MEMNQETLGLFDIHRVLIQPRDPAFQIVNMKKYDYTRFMKGLTEEEKREVWREMTLLPGATLLEADAPCILHRLENRGIPLAALTSTLTTQQFEEIERLRKLGMTFIPLGEDESVFSNLPKFDGHYPTYRGGILFCNGEPKGEVLVAFLKQLDLQPKKIVFIDDQKFHLEEVERALLKYDESIVFTGYLYTGGDDYPSEEISKEEFDARWQRFMQQMALSKTR